jgi:hypothetical protein
MRAAAVRNVPQSTISSQRTGRPSQRSTRPESSAPTKSEEDALVLNKRDLYLRGYAPKHLKVCDMADQLLAAGGGHHVRDKWVYRLVER